LHCALPLVGVTLKTQGAALRNRIQPTRATARKYSPLPFSLCAVGGWSAIDPRGRLTLADSIAI